MVLDSLNYRISSSAIINDIIIVGAIGNDISLGLLG